jgi:hypothetical protein
MTTDELVERIALNSRPVTPLRHPVRAGMVWAAAMAAYFSTLAATQALIVGGGFSGLPLLLLLAQVAAFVTGGAAAVAALTLIIPGESRRVVAWPIASSLVWASTLLVGAVRESRMPTPALQVQNEWVCVAFITLGSLLPVAVIVRALRQGAPLAPRLTLALTVLGAAGLANVAACLAHPHSSSTSVLLWHGATIAGLVLLGAAAGRSVLVRTRLPLAPER